MDSELIGIGIALLGIILGTWFCLHRLSRKLDRLLSAIESSKKEEDSDHASHV